MVYYKGKFKNGEKKKINTLLLHCNMAMQGSELDRECKWIGVQSHWN